MYICIYLCIYYLVEYIYQTHCYPEPKDIGFRSGTDYFSEVYLEWSPVQTRVAASFSSNSSVVERSIADTFLHVASSFLLSVLKPFPTVPPQQKSLSGQDHLYILKYALLTTLIGTFNIIRDNMVNCQKNNIMRHPSL